jgi:hypothetical protein
VSDLPSLLDKTAARLLSGDAGLGLIPQLDHALDNIRLHVSAEDWRNEVQAFCLSHPLRKLVHQDPFTRRAFEKPRGYAGDAIMLDYVYSGMPPPETTIIGRQVFFSTIRVPNSLSVIERRNYLAELIDNTARETIRPRILSVACGHLREAHYSNATRSGAVAALYALDQDPQSLAVIERDKPKEANIITVNASVKALLQGEVCYSNLNLIYALGLYDYLIDSVAKKLTETLFEMLAPDGKLVFANYAPDSRGLGYMEAFMDWVLIHRDEVALQACASGINSARISGTRLFRDRYRNIVYLEISKAH